MAGARLGRLQQWSSSSSGAREKLQDDPLYQPLSPHPLPPTPLTVALLDRKGVLKYASTMSPAGLGATQPTQKRKILAPKSTLLRTACERWLSEKKGKETQNHYSKIANELHPAMLCPCLCSPNPCICCESLWTRYPYFFRSKIQPFRGWELRGLEARYKHSGCRNKASRDGLWTAISH